jgi:hypothetical protein
MGDDSDSCDGVPSMNAAPSVNAVPNLNATASSQAGSQPPQIPPTPMATLGREQPTGKTRGGQTSKKKSAARAAFATGVPRQQVKKPIGRRLELVTPPMDMSLPCIFLGKDAIPLWPQYGLVGGPPDTRTWLQIHLREGWFHEYVVKFQHKETKDGTASSDKRKLSKILSDSLDLVLRKAISKTRKKHAATSNSEILEFSDEERAPADPDDKATEWGMRMASHANPSLVVEIGEFRLTMLNSLRPMCLQVDAMSQKFITSYFPHALAEAQRGAQGKRGAQVLPAPSQLPTFSFQDQDTPNIRDKVIWHVPSHTWKIHVKKPKTVCGPDCKSFPVDSKLSFAEYDQAKRAAYERAKNSWNEIDGTNRKRIGKAVPLPKPTAQTCEFGSMSERWTEEML